MLRFFVRATFAVALSFSTLPTLAQNKASRSETYKDIIEKAHNLSLQRDRQQALNILTTAIRRETKPAAIAELKKTVNEIGNFFFSDKAQQLYEVGVSLRKTDLSQALSKLNEASRIEPDNVAIVTELSRLMIAKNDCSNANELLTKQAKLSPYDEELKIALAHALLCQGQTLEAGKLMDNKENGKASPYAPYWLALEVDRYVRSKNPIKAQETWTILEKADPKYPEISYWRWKVDILSKKTNAEAAQKYVMTCKNISASQYRQYMIDPMLCRRMVELENELKGLNETPE